MRATLAQQHAGAAWHARHRRPEPVGPVDFPLPRYVPTKADIVALTPTIADAHKLPSRLLMLLLLGEAGHELQSFERWYLYTAEAKAAIERRDKGTLRAILARCAAVVTPYGQGTDDISAGAAHQAWRWSPEYNGKRYDLDSILAFRALYIENPRHALTTAAVQLARHYRTAPNDSVDAWLDVCARYNKPAVDPRANPARAVYARGVPLLDALLPDNRGGTEPEPAAVPWGRVRLTSAKYDGRTRPIVGIVWHTLEGSTDGALDWWENCQCGSAQFIVSRDGTITLAVKLHDRAWHAGGTTLAGGASARSGYWRTVDANEHTVGIELEGFANREPFPEAQLAACERLAVWLTRQYGIAADYLPNDVRGHKLHSDVSNQRSDPGRFFPLARMLAACARA